MSSGSRALYLVSFLLMLLTVLCGFTLPQVVRFVVDDVIGGTHETYEPLWASLLESLGLGVSALRETRALIVVLVFCIAVMGGIFNFTYHKSLAKASEGLVKRLRDGLYSHIQNLPYEWHIGIQTGDIIQRCTSDVEIVRNFVSNQVVEVVRTVTLIVFAYSILFQMNLTLALASCIFLPIILFNSYFFLRKAAVNFLAADEAEGQLLSIAQENFTGIRVVRAFGRERYEIDRFDRQNRHFAELWMKLGMMLSTYWGLSDALTGLQMIVTCAAGVLEAVKGGITIGEFIVFLSYNSMIIWPVRALGRVLSEAGKTWVSLERLQEIFDTPQEYDAPDSVLETPIDGDIEFDHVDFSYGNAANSDTQGVSMPVLQDVSFTVKRGTTLGILGATGSGKTTIAHLLCRLYDLGDTGAIYIGGVDIRRYKRRWLRENVGIVLQEPFLFSRTIRENIASLSPGYSMEQIRAAAATAQVDEAIEQFEDGYDTLVGERGVTLSGGQKQRVAIARTILKETPILIFDDSLSAVDTETDAKINAALRQVTRNVTTLIISHRIASVLQADKIVVMEYGRVVEYGSPSELLLRGGIFKRLHDMQSSLEEIDE
jgi:ATP-binding cassette subfamily B protein